MVHFFSLLLEALERTRSRVGQKYGKQEWSSERVWKKIVWSGIGAAKGGCEAGNEAGTRTHKNRLERRAEILPLPLRSHALLVICNTVSQWRRGGTV